MKYYPDALPFWELVKPGPISKAVASRQRLANKFKVKDYRQKLLLLESNLMSFRETGAIREVERTKRRIKSLQEQLHEAKIRLGLIKEE
jgi:hypothetical protein